MPLKRYSTPPQQGKLYKFDTDRPNEADSWFYGMTLDGKVALPVVRPRQPSDRGDAIGEWFRCFDNHGVGERVWLGNKDMAMLVASGTKNIILLTGEGQTVMVSIEYFYKFFKEAASAEQE